MKRNPALRRKLSLGAIVLLSACAAPAPAPAADPSVKVSLANSGTEPLHCRLIFGHWVERDLGLLAPGATVAFAVQQSRSDGALYIMRADGLRRMMIENLLCGRDPYWSASVGDVDLAPARSTRPGRIAASCAEPSGGGRVRCAPARLKP